MKTAIKGTLIRRTLSLRGFKVSNRKPYSDGSENIDRTRKFVTPILDNAKERKAYAEGVINTAGACGCSSLRWFDEKENAYKVAVHFRWNPNGEYAE